MWDRRTREQRLGKVSEPFTLGEAMTILFLGLLTTFVMIEIFVV